MPCSRGCFTSPRGRSLGRSGEGSRAPGTPAGRGQSWEKVLSGTVCRYRAPTVRSPEQTDGHTTVPTLNTSPETDRERRHSLLQTRSRCQELRSLVDADSLASVGARYVRGRQTHVRTQWQASAPSWLSARAAPTAELARHERPVPRRSGTGPDLYRPAGTGPVHIGFWQVPSEGDRTVPFPSSA